MKDFFEDLGKRLGETAETMSNKAGDAIEIQKLKSQIRSLARGNAVDLMELGKTIYDRFNKIYLLKPGRHEIRRLNYQYVSFFSVDRAIISLEKMAYPLDHYLLKYEDGLCVSNEILGSKGILMTDAPVFCIQSNSRL